MNLETFGIRAVHATTHGGSGTCAIGIMLRNKHAHLSKAAYSNSTGGRDDRHRSPLLTRLDILWVRLYQSSSRARPFLVACHGTHHLYFKRPVLQGHTVPNFLL